MQFWTEIIPQLQAKLYNNSSNGNNAEEIVTNMGFGTYMCTPQSDVEHSRDVLRNSSLILFCILFLLSGVLTLVCIGLVMYIFCKYKSQKGKKTCNDNSPVNV